MDWLGLGMKRIVLPLLLLAASIHSVITSAPSTCESLAQNGNCTFYTECVESHIPCGSTGYAIGYGYHFCNAFGELSDSFNQEGQQWIDNVRRCLTTALYFSTEYQSSGTCEQLREFAFSSHPECYVSNGFCSIIRSFTNLRGLFNVLKTRLSALFTSLAVKQVIDTACLCLSESNDRVQDSWYSAIATAAEDLFRGFLQDILDCQMASCTQDFLIMFILDSSGSIAPADYETMKGFVVNVIRSLNATEESKIGVINFSSSPQLVVPLTSARDLSSLVNQVRAIEYIGGGTRTDTALDLMEENFRLTPDNGAIPIGILLTDGQSNSPSLTLEAAARVHAADISMYTFGIGDTNPEELRAIASTPYSDYSFYISTFSAADFEQRVFSLTRQACSTPEVGQLGEPSSHSVSQGEMSYITYPFEPEGVTLQFRVEEGTLDVFGSFNVRNPTRSTADFNFVAELQTTHYVSPESFEQATGMQLNGGRLARQVASENATTEHSLFITIMGLNEMNSFDVTTVPGEDAGTFAFIRGNLRLQHGATPNEGRVEVFMDGDWQTICDDSWDIVDADIACRQLGLGYAVAAPTGNYYPFATAGIWKVDVNCTGSERKLIDCHAPSTLPKTDCFHHEDAGTVCSGQALREGALRLAAGGNSISDGFLEMYYSSQWGSICSTGWDIVDTAVACSQLGFTDMNSINFTVSAKSSAGSQPIHSSNVQCNGEEPTIFACSQDPFGNNSCSHSSVVMVMCGTSSALGATQATFSAVLVAILAAVLC